MHRQNKTHDTEDCFELKKRAKHAKSNANQNEADKVTYKDLNAFVNAKVSAALNKAKKSSNEEGNLNEHAPAADNNDDSDASCLLSNDSDSNVSA
eukprot:14900878-Ditylum_brightwellii.AAC.1